MSPPVRTLYPEKIVEFEGSGTSCLSTPSANRLIVVHGGLEFEIFEKLEKLTSFKINDSEIDTSNIAIHPHKEIIATTVNARDSDATESAQISFWDFSGTLLHRAQVKGDYYDFDGPAISYDASGHFMLVSPEKEENTLSIWHPDSALTDLGNLELASDSIAVTGSTGAFFHHYQIQEWSSIVFCHAHDACSDIQFFSIHDGKINKQWLIENVVKAAAFAPNKLQFTMMDDLYEISVHRTDTKPASDNIPPKLHLTFPWPEHPAEEDFSNHYGCYIDQDTVALSSDYGRIYLFNTKARGYIGEVQIEGHELRQVQQWSATIPTARGCWSVMGPEDYPCSQLSKMEPYGKYIMLSYNTGTEDSPTTTLAFVKQEQFS